ncbi:hypothetical protein BDY21DRAFT_79644 [Lineolata rhizophorae]|uniref:DRBM domain-containing protein n=1 Tax=Lineolata rhizophorae TaxID=578093 RepID=A0A6A6NUM1_9PEZI|nr:hypothetical protein BDY21DRAFT_79644 [Lineolata rhizophorae]
MTSQSPNGSTTPTASTYWQDKLRDLCNTAQYRQPVYNISSDRRGGRTAWSCTIEVEGRRIPARYWYDGNFIHNAREDAAEMALQYLNQLQQHQQQQSPQQNPAWYGYHQ